jgi:Tfp pilus assembly protein PilF
MKALDSGDSAGAKTAFEAALKKNPKDADANFYLGVTLEKTGDKAGAEKRYKEALAARPDLDSAAVNLGALYIDGGRADEALLVTRQALQKQPKNPALHTNLALGLAAKNDAAGASRAFEEAVKLAPNDPMIKVTYAQFLGAGKHLEEAAAMLRAARPLAKELGVLAAIGHELRLVGAFSDCVPTFDKAIEAKDAAELRTERALCKVGAKDDAGALEDLQTAVKKEPNYAPAHFYLANRLAQGGKFADAVKEYDAYIRLAPKGDLAKQAQERAKLAREKAKKK